jgi:predicted adenine nucleotide alpha hydrolase (AANH) superfamily ATPase
MPQETEFIKFDFKKKSVEGNLLAHSFESDGYRFVYVPSLNISGYGNSQEEAQEMVNISIRDFLETLFSAGESKAYDEIKKLGWRKQKYSAKKYTAPFVDKDGILREFNLSKETRIETSSLAV